MGNQTFKFDQVKDELVKVILFLACAIISNAKATVVQILHTNDNHSFLDHSDRDPKRGGYARLKNMIDDLKSDAAKKNIPTLVVDAGDFLEGNLYFMADNGRKVLNIHNQIKYDATVLGNHDYLMGTEQLDQLLGDTQTDFALLGANVYVDKRYPNIREKLKRYKEFEVDGKKIAFVGLTTNEVLYKWRLYNGDIFSPYEIGSNLSNELRRRGNDLIIALTHIGVIRDIKLAKESRNIDLIIGGHSHTTLFEPIYQANINKKNIPIVQAGKHLEYLGRILIDIDSKGKYKLLEYKLLPVDVVLKDLQVNELVSDAKTTLYQQYGEFWLNEYVGDSLIDKNDAFGQLKWAYYATDAIREASGAEIAIHSPDMSGENFPVGAITRMDLFNSYPRVFEFENKYGWKIYNSKIRGVWLKTVIKYLSGLGHSLTFSGISVEYKKIGNKFTVKDVRVNGKRINPFRNYTVAFPEGVIRGAKGISSYTKTLIKHPRQTTEYVWFALETKLKREKAIRSNYLSEYKDPYDQSTVEHSFFPGGQMEESEN